MSSGPLYYLDRLGIEIFIPEIAIVATLMWLKGPT